jgi:predicted nucleic acid-binding protein
MFLLDTNVISELRKPKPHGGVVAWIEQVPEHQLFLSALSLGELQAGVELTRRQDSLKAVEIEAWIDQVAQSYQILPMDIHTFREWARLMNGRAGQLMEDAMIAATARVHGLTVVTRNVSDFSGFKLELVNPFSGRE